jgi:hypothetical protein
VHQAEGVEVLVVADGPVFGAQDVADAAEGVVEVLDPAGDVAAAGAGAFGACGVVGR